MKTETGAPMYFEAVPVELDPIAGLEIEIEGKHYVLRPIPVTQGVSDEVIDLMTKDICRKKFGNIYFREDDLDSIEISLKAMRSHLTPLLSAQAAEIEHWQGEAYKAAEECGSTCGKEIEELKQQLADQKSKERERAIGFAEWFNNLPTTHNEKTWAETLNKYYSLYLTSLTKQSEGK